MEDAVKENSCSGGLEVLIIGASLGLGKEIAAVYGSLNASTALASRSEKQLELAARYARNSGAQHPIVIGVDVTNLDEVKRMINAVYKEYGSIKRLIYNAGQGMQGCLSRLKRLSDYSAVYDVTFQGLMNVAHIAVPILREQMMQKGVRAKFITTVCMSGKMGIAKMSLFSAAKHAVVGLMGSIRDENRDYFDVLTVFPGVVDTDMQERLINDDGEMSGPNGSYFFDAKWMKSDVYYMGAKVAAAEYVANVECKSTVRDYQDGEVYLDWYNRMSVLFRPWSPCIANFLSYMSTRIPGQDVFAIPARFLHAVQDVQRLSEAIKDCNKDNDCAKKASILPEIKVLEQKIKDK